MVGSPCSDDVKLASGPRLYVKLTGSRVRRGHPVAADVAGCSGSRSQRVRVGRVDTRAGWPSGSVVPSSPGCGAYPLSGAGWAARPRRPTASTNYPRPGPGLRRPWQRSCPMRLTDRSSQPPVFTSPPLSELRTVPSRRTPCCPSTPRNYPWSGLSLLVARPRHEITLGPGCRCLGGAAADSLPPTPSVRAWHPSDRSARPSTSCAPC
jgi:hypothetical protein